MPPHELVMPQVNYNLNFTLIAVSLLYDNYLNFNSDSSSLNNNPLPVPLAYTEKNAANLYMTARVRSELLVDDINYPQCHQDVVKCHAMDMLKKKQARHVEIDEEILYSLGVDIHNLDTSNLDAKLMYTQALNNLMLPNRKKITSLLVFEHIYNTYNNGKFDFVWYYDVDVDIVHPLMILKKIDFLKSSFSVFTTESHSNILHGKKRGENMCTDFIIAKPQCFQGVSLNNFSVYANDLLRQRLGALNISTSKRLPLFSSESASASSKTGHNVDEINIDVKSITKYLEQHGVTRDEICCVDEESYIQHVLRNNCPAIYFMDYFDHCIQPLPIDYQLCNSVHRKTNKDRLHPHDHHRQW